MSSERPPTSQTFVQIRSHSSFMNASLVYRSAGMMSWPSSGSSAFQAGVPSGQSCGLTRITSTLRLTSGMAVPRVSPRRSEMGAIGEAARSEEHTSELQSLMRISYAVFCLKKKKKTNRNKIYIQDTTHLIYQVSQ